MWGVMFAHLGDLDLMAHENQTELHLKRGSKLAIENFEFGLELRSELHSRHRILCRRRALAQLLRLRAGDNTL